ELLDDFESIACVIVKHNNPCGVALANSSIEAYQKALSCDPKSAFGGIVAFNSKIDLKTAERLNDIFLEVVILPELDDSILNELKRKKDRRIVLYKKKVLSEGKSFRTIPGGLLVQDKDNLTLDENKLEFVTNRKPTDEEFTDLKFAWIVAKHVKSNAIIYAKNRMTIGIGAGQMSRVDSSKIAEMKAKEFGHNTNGCVVASDAFFPFADGLESAVSIGATAVIQPGGSIRDKEVIEFANKNNLAMVFTHVRHFKH
ncbi:MAG: bifunctional phosphoribosylaminoimidazolecarboxamide formyltransferase/IMP cyclohydrolase, partial [Ignavibacteria bacterium]|nr:bifunctional phosphoribosylaminoimidazolecarboxamide formyltransferase/IMP cyclohydrolase [Ignavibacteria bacterium]